MAGGDVGIRGFEIDGVDHTKPLESILQGLARQLYPGTNFPVSNHPSREFSPALSLNLVSTTDMI